MKRTLGAIPKRGLLSWLREWTGVSTRSRLAQSWSARGGSTSWGGGR
ncbi:hypothetical protein [Streptomyces sp. NPDC057301]